MLVGDDEGHLGLVARPVAVVEPVVAGDGDDVVAEHRHQRHAIGVVDVAEVLDLLLAFRCAG
ncbi:MAG: hypothetical protein R2726_07505 [Acidimicrobiales bacterium]